MKDIAQDPPPDEWTQRRERERAALEQPHTVDPELLERTRSAAPQAADREREHSLGNKRALQKQLAAFEAVRDHAAPPGGVGVLLSPPSADDSAAPGGVSQDQLQAPPAPPRGSRRGEALRKQDERDARRRERFVQSCRDRGIPDEAIPPDIPARSYRMVQTILADTYGKTTLRMLQDEARARSGYPMALLRNAIGGDAADFTQYETRVVVAAAMLLLSLARRVKRKGRWTLLVAGIGINSIAACLHRPGDPTDRPHRNTIGGAARKAEAARLAAYRARWSGHERTTSRRTPFEGVLKRLRQCGFLYAQQLPSECVRAWERDSRPGHQHHVRLRYWLACLSFPEMKRQRREPSRLGGELLGMLQAEFERLNTLGFEWIAGLLAPRQAPS